MTPARRITTPATLVTPLDDTARVRSATRVSSHIAPASGLAYQVHGQGDPVLLLPPAATSADVFATYQVPALTRAGYQVILANHRGTPPSRVPPGPYRLDDLVTDTATLIEELDFGACPVVGASLGAMVAQELVLARPDLVTAAVLVGTRCRTGFFHRKIATATAAHIRTGTPDGELGTLSHLAHLFGVGTLLNERMVQDWFLLLRQFPARGEGAAAQHEATTIEDRMPALRAVTRRCLVVAFTGDVLTPVAMCREVADAIPDCRLVEIADAGHFGFLERPDVVNAAIIDFLRAGTNPAPSDGDDRRRQFA